MKKIGILFGQENTFPQALIDRINLKKDPHLTAEAVFIDKVIQDQPTGYTVIIDLISHVVPFYRSYVKHAALTGTAVINNPFWWSADEKFFGNALAQQLGVPVPRAVLLPSNQPPHNTNANTFRNLMYPMDWQGIFEYVGFPARLKPHAGDSSSNVHFVANPDEFFQIHSTTGQQVMMLQEEINFQEYYRCFCVGARDVHIMRFSPRSPFHLRYAGENSGTPRRLVSKMKAYSIRLSEALGYDINAIEFAVRDGVPYAVDFLDPVPDTDIYSIGDANFEWIVEAVANLAMQKAHDQHREHGELTWGGFVDHNMGFDDHSHALQNKSVHKEEGFTGSSNDRVSIKQDRDAVANKTAMDNAASSSKRTRVTDNSENGL
jgi:glutathione synthase/RimK-type ligase-like ATP-grasp enzyme